jgi:hypothetical protein
LGSLRYTSEEMLYPLSSLSGGQKAKLFLLKMVLEEKNVLLLDEPTRNLSPFSVRMLDNLLDSFKEGPSSSATTPLSLSGVIWPLFPDVSQCYFSFRWVTPEMGFLRRRRFFNACYQESGNLIVFSSFFVGLLR